MKIIAKLTNQLTRLTMQVNTAPIIETKVTKKIESVPDPGLYDRSYENFHIR